MIKQASYKFELVQFVSSQKELVESRVEKQVAIFYQDCRLWRTHWIYLAPKRVPDVKSYQLPDRIKLLPKKTQNHNLAIFERKNQLKREYILGVCWENESFSAVQGPNWWSILASYTDDIRCFCTTVLRSHRENNEFTKKRAMRIHRVL